MNGISSAATAPTARGRDRREREPRLAVKWGQDIYRTVDWSLTGLLLDAVPEEIWPKPNEAVKLTLLPLQDGLQPVDVMARLARRGDGWVGLNLATMSREVMDYFALALLLHDAAKRGVQPLGAALLPKTRAVLDAEQQDLRSQTIHNLMLDAQRVAGLEVGASVQAKLARIVDAAPLKDIAAWAGELSRLPGSHPEWIALIEMLTVHETYLFRDPQQLDAMATLLPDRIAAAATRDRRLTLWSAGCSTGEEAWSLAILALRAMVKAGVATEHASGFKLHPGWRLDVVGTDVSRQVLRVAEAGVYAVGEVSAFRALPPVMAPYFPEGDEPRTRRVRDDLRPFVRFQPYNLVEEVTPVRAADVVLCRNVLIYFTDLLRVAVQKRLVAQLNPGGLLLLGTTDRLLAPGEVDIIDREGTVLYRRRD